MELGEEQFGKTADYVRAFESVLAEGIPEKHMALLRAHLAAPRHTTTWARLAEAVGYSTGSSVNLQYGKLAERITRQLGCTEKPVDSNGGVWWLWALVHWADERDAETGHTAFVLRRPVVEALQQLEIALEARAVSPLADDELTMMEGARQRVVSSEYERNPAARRACIEHYGTSCSVCKFSFEAMYGQLGIGFIHVHHLIPLASIGRAYHIDPVADLRPVCPNCHAMLHSENPPLAVEQLRKAVADRKGA